VIPAVDLDPTVPTPPPECALPSAEEISEEGFGYFRGTWFMGRVPVREAAEIVACETDMIAWLDRVATSAEEFELLASAIESADTYDIDEPLLTRATAEGLDRLLPGPEDLYPLEGLEIGVSGIAHALSALGFRTAASCRSHVNERSWSDCPIVFFAGPTWRVRILVKLVATYRCGLIERRGMLSIYARSIIDMNGLASRLLEHRTRFRKNPDRPTPTTPRFPRENQSQLF
jgi:hypothetical protein